MSHLVSGINFLVLSVNLIPVPVSHLVCSCSYHIFSLCQLTTLTIHNSLSLSLPAQDLHVSRTFHTINSIPASGLTPSLFDWTVSSDHLGFLFLLYSFCFLVGSVRQTKLATRQLSGARKCSYCIIALMKYRGLSCCTCRGGIAGHSRSTRLPLPGGEVLGSGGGAVLGSGAECWHHGWTSTCD